MPNLQQRLDSAIEVLNKFGILPSEDETSRMADLLDELVEVDADRVTAIGRVMQYIGSFNELVRDEIEDIKVADRYSRITDLFDSIREDAAKMVGQLEDKEIDFSERVSNYWMRLVRGGIPKRFEKIKGIYDDVTRDTGAHLEREGRILAAYLEFRGAMKESEGLAHEVTGLQETRLAAARDALDAGQSALDALESGDAEPEGAELARAQLARDEALQRFNDEEKRLHLATDIAEHLKLGYNVSETIMAKLQQTHDVKEQVYRRSVTFFGTNEHVFTALAATYVAQLGLHEQTQTVEAMTEGVNKSLETLAEIGGKVEQEALEAAHGPTIRAEVIQKLVDAVVEYQTTSRQRIRELRDASAQNAAEVERIVEEGKDEARRVIAQYAAA
jgi:hypothetical protein